MKKLSKLEASGLFFHKLWWFLCKSQNLLVSTISPVLEPPNDGLSEWSINLKILQVDLSSLQCLNSLPFHQTSHIALPNEIIMVLYLPKDYRDIATKQYTDKVANFCMVWYKSTVPTLADEYLSPACHLSNSGIYITIIISIVVHLPLLIIAGHFMPLLVLVPHQKKTLLHKH